MYMDEQKTVQGTDFWLPVFPSLFAPTLSVLLFLVSQMNLSNPINFKYARLDFLVYNFYLYHFSPFYLSPYYTNVFA